MFVDDRSLIEYFKHFLLACKNLEQFICLKIIHNSSDYKPVGISLKVQLPFKLQITPKTDHNMD